MLPPNLAWQRGKTAATLQWVRALEAELQEQPDNEVLVRVIEALKKGDLVAEEFYKTDKLDRS